MDIEKIYIHNLKREFSYVRKNKNYHLFFLNV